MSKVSSTIATQPFANSVAALESRETFTHSDVKPGKHSIAALEAHTKRQTPKRTSVAGTVGAHWHPSANNIPDNGNKADDTDETPKQRTDLSKKFVTRKGVGNAL